MILDLMKLKITGLLVRGVSRDHRRMISSRCAIICALYLSCLMGTISAMTGDDQVGVTRCRHGQIDDRIRRPCLDCARARTAGRRDPPLPEYKLEFHAPKSSSLPAGMKWHFRRPDQAWKVTGDGIRGPNRFKTKSMKKPVHVPAGSIGYVSKLKSKFAYLEFRDLEITIKVGNTEPNIDIYHSRGRHIRKLKVPATSTPHPDTKAPPKLEYIEYIEDIPVGPDEFHFLSPPENRLHGQLWKTRRSLWKLQKDLTRTTTMSLRTYP